MNRPLRSLCLAATLAAPLAPQATAAAQTSDSVPAVRRDARRWYQDAKFGMFIHWGVYSQLAQGEWVMQQREIPVPKYEWLASAFNPIRFDAREGVAPAKAAGVRSITITSRPHDGFSMFKSAPSPCNIVASTPFKRAPLSELLTNYGPLGGIWFDGMWDKPTADWRLPSTYALIHRLQPAALIVPNHHKAPLPGEDVQTFEQDLPGANTAGFNTKEIGALPM